MDQEPNKKLSKRLMLKDTHPTMQKIQKLYALAEDLGITISFHGQATTVEDRDRDSNLPILYLEDLDDGEGPQMWPPTFEFKLVYDNPAFLAEQKREWDERRAAEAAKTKDTEDKRKAKEAAEKAREAKAKEDRERKLLAELKEKYEQV